MMILTKMKLTSIPAVNITSPFVQPYRSTHRLDPSRTRMPSSTMPSMTRRRFCRSTALRKNVLNTFRLGLYSTTPSIVMGGPACHRHLPEGIDAASTLNCAADFETSMVLQRRVKVVSTACMLTAGPSGHGIAFRRTTEALTLVWQCRARACRVQTGVNTTKLTNSRWLHPIQRLIRVALWR